jgi:hypothetical protein
MCRAVAAGGRRCPGCRGENRRAYQRRRYAALKAATTTAPPARTRSAPHPEPAEPALHRQRVLTAAAVDAALTALRDPDHGTDPDVEAAYTAAVLAHGAVLRDIAADRIDAAYQAHGVDDASCHTEALDFTARLAAAAQARDNHPDPVAAENAYAAIVTDLVAQMARRSAAIEARRAELAAEIYWAELARERTFGGQSFQPANHDKMSRADRALFTQTTALYPDEMIAHAAALGPMLAKRSKARAHYTRGAVQRRRRTRTQLFDVTEGRLRWSHYVESIDALAAGAEQDRLTADAVFVPRTPENEERLARMVDAWNLGRANPAALRYTTAVFGGSAEPRDAIYIQGPLTRTDYAPTGVSAELTFADARSMTHELAHRVEDTNREISVATKALLARRTAGLPSQRYARSERVVPDNFAHAYIGKDYPGHHTELFSCGMEALTAGCFGGLRGTAPVSLGVLAGITPRSAATESKADPEHLALVLGLLASANKTIPG